MLSPFVKIEQSTSTSKLHLDTEAKLWHSCAVAAEPRSQGVGWPPMLEVGVKAISLTPSNVWVMWCWCCCPALRSTFSYLKRTKMQDFDQKFSFFGGCDSGLPRRDADTPSRTIPRIRTCFLTPNIFYAPPPLFLCVSQCVSSSTFVYLPVRILKLRPCPHNRWLHRRMTHFLHTTAERLVLFFHWL